MFENRDDTTDDIAYLEDLFAYPAINESTQRLYVIHANTIVGEVRIGAKHYYNGLCQVITIYYGEDTPFWKDDSVVALLGTNTCFKFLSHTGKYRKTYGDEPIERSEYMQDFTLVDSMYFDFGLASKLRFGHIPGYGVKSKHNR